MDERTFWNKIFKYATVAFCVVIVSSFSSCQASKYQIRKSIEAGSTAIEAACAFDYGNVSDTSICVVEMMTKTED